jgi:quinol monooxygenase YgiN
MAHVDVVAIVRVKPEAIEVARPQIEVLIEASRAEQGVLRYDWYHDAHEPTTFVVIERYASQEAFEQHKAT